MSSLLWTILIVFNPEDVNKSKKLSSVEKVSINPHFLCTCSTLYLVLVLPAFLDTGLSRGNGHEQDFMDLLVFKNHSHNIISMAIIMAFV